MACPFARFTRSLGIDSDSDDDSTTSSSSFASTSSKITTKLKDGTWEIHREIEKSPGVRALMGNFHHAELSIQLDRLSHLRFLIMLASVYLAMEAALVQEKTVLSDMMPLLFRSHTLLEDIQIHLNEILDGEGSQISQLDAAIDEEATLSHQSIFDQLRAAQTILVRAQLLDGSSTTAPLLTADHIALLDKRQALAIQNYVKQLFNLGSRNQRSRQGHKDEGISFTPFATPQSSRTTSSTSLSRDASTFATSNVDFDNNLILSHAYVRYMGDLSGGQHIVKRLSKLFPIYHQLEREKDSNTKIGFSFYYFDSNTGKNTIELKSMIRSRLDSIVLSTSQSNKMVEEACLAFRLNGKLLDSLVDEDSSIDFIHQDGNNYSSQSLAFTLIRHPSHLAYFVPSTVFHPHMLATLVALFAVECAASMYALGA